MSDKDESATTKVLLLNDEETTMEFVVHVLEDIFGKTHEEALKLVLDINANGSGVCGVYTPEQASEVVERVTELVRRNHYPLRCRCMVEPDGTA
jgi:ATP-dependent Clp protease adaptor protein ClpS